MQIRDQNELSRVSINKRRLNSTIFMFNIPLCTSMRLNKISLLIDFQRFVDVKRSWEHV